MVLGCAIDIVPAPGDAGVADVDMDGGEYEETTPATGVTDGVALEAMAGV
jgi:hypothetical protein